MIIANLKYNKTTFLRKWRNIVNDHNVGDKLHGKMLEFIKGALKISDKYKKIGYSAKFKAKIGSIKFGPKGKQKPVKGIMVMAMGMRSYQFISQTDIHDELFPPKNNTQEKKKNRADVLAMMRQQIQPQIDEFKEAWDNYMELIKKEDTVQFNERKKCPLSGKDLTKVDVAVDHDIPFIKLAKEFWRINNIDPFTTTVMGGPYDRKFEKEHLNNAWRDFHKKESKLQVVEKRANLSKNRKSTEEFLKQERKAAVAKSKPRTLNPNK